MDGKLGEYWRILEARVDGVWFSDMSSINLNDLSNARPGTIVRFRQLPAVQYVTPSYESFDHVAGLISDAA